RSADLPSPFDTSRRVVSFCRLLSSDVTGSRTLVTASDDSGLLMDVNGAFMSGTDSRRRIVDGAADVDADGRAATVGAAVVVPGVPSCRRKPTLPNEIKSPGAARPD